jgi:hypothetical protein
MEPRKPGKPGKPGKPSDKLQPKSGVVKPKTVSSALKPPSISLEPPSISPELSKAYCSRIGPLRGTPLVMDSDLIPIHVPSASSEPADIPSPSSEPADIPSPSSEPVDIPSRYISGMMVFDPVRESWRMLDTRAYDPVYVMDSTPSSQFIGLSRKKKKSVKFRPCALNMAQVALAAPDKKAAYFRQMAMEEHMRERFGDGPGATAGSIGDSMNLANYNTAAPENFGDNPEWDETHIPAFLAQEEERKKREGKGGSRKRTKKYTRKQRRSRRKTFRRKRT